MSLFWSESEIREFSEKTQCPLEDVLDFSGNLNPLGVPFSVKKLFPELVENLAYFSDRQSREFCGEVARHYPLWPENVIAGGSVTDLLRLAVRTLAPRRALILEPCFGEYRRILNLQGAEVRSLLLKEAESFRFSLPQILNALMGVDLLILGHPNNPTGTSLEKEELRVLLEEAKRRHIFVIVDESFCDWSPELSVAREIKDSAFFMVVRTMTYFYSLAGMQCSYGLGARKLIEKMRGRQDIYAANTIAQRLAIEALRDQEYQERSRDWFYEERPWFSQSLERVYGVKAYPTRTHFTLLRLRGRLEADGLLQTLAGQGILMRGYQHFVGLDQSYLRVSLRLRKENERLLSLLEEWLQKHAGSLKSR